MALGWDGSYYTQLCFIVLPGQCGMVELLLVAGARTSMTNNLGKTAANMAAFIGRHDEDPSLALVLLVGLGEDSCQHGRLHR